MVNIILRGLFLIVTAAVAALYASRGIGGNAVGFIMWIMGALIVAGGIIYLDAVTPRKKLSSISGMFLGLLVGMVAAYAINQSLIEYVGLVFSLDTNKELFQGIKVFVGVICVFSAITLIIQTKDDFRFVIPYVEFAKQIRGNRPMLLDTSAIIDGRIVDVADTQILQGLVVIPKFVINELQTISDSSDKIKRARGRRGLDIVAKLQNHTQLEVSIEDSDVEGPTVDQKLVTLAQDLRARLVTTDFNLAKVARLRAVDVINVNDLANAMRPVVLPGESLQVQILKPGEGPSQGVGYLEDGTMVVVEGTRNLIGHNVQLAVTSMLQTAAGRMIFGRLLETMDQQDSDGNGHSHTAPRPTAQRAGQATTHPAHPRSTPPRSDR